MEAQQKQQLMNQRFHRTAISTPWKSANKLVSAEENLHNMVPNVLRVVPTQLVANLHPPPQFFR